MRVAFWEMHILAFQTLYNNQVKHLGRVLLILSCFAYGALLGKKWEGTTRHANWGVFVENWPENALKLKRLSTARNMMFFTGWMLLILVELFLHHSIREKKEC